MTDDATRQCHKLLSGYDLLLGSRAELQRVIDNTTLDALRADPAACGTFARFCPDDELPATLKTLKATGLDPALPDRAALLVGGIFGEQLPNLPAIQLPVEQTRFLAPFVAELTTRALLQGDAGGFVHLCGRDPFACFGIDLDALERAQPIEALRPPRAAELASYAALQGPYADSDVELAEIFAEELIDALRKSKDRVRAAFPGAVQRLLVLVPNWIMLRGTEGEPYDPRRNESVLGAVRD